MNRLMRRSATTAAALLLLTVSACGGGAADGGGNAEPAGETTAQSSPTEEQMTTEASPTEETTQTAGTLTTAQSEFGEILVDGQGMTVYMFQPDENGQSTCDAECLDAWPPVEGPLRAAEGVDAPRLGTTQATDGTTMATYNGWPLYYFVQDQQPGDVTGQGVNDVWWVLGPDGEPIRQMSGGGGGSGGY